MRWEIRFYVVIIAGDSRGEIAQLYFPRFTRDCDCPIFVADLQIGVLEKVHRMEPVLRLCMKERRLFRGSFGCEVGLNIFVPKTETRKDVARHVKRVRCRRGNLCVPASRIEAQWGHPWVIGGMNDEMDDTGIVGFDL